MRFEVAFKSEVWHCSVSCVMKIFIKVNCVRDLVSRSRSDLGFKWERTSLAYVPICIALSQR